MTMTIEKPIPGQLLWEEYQPYIQKITRSMAYSFYGVEEEDIAQEVWVFLWKKEQYFLANNSSPAYIKASIKNIAKNYCYRIRSQTMVTQDTFYYSVDEVKALMPVFFETHDAWANADVPPGADFGTTSDPMELLVDISMAYQQLTPGQQEVLRRRYSDDEGLAESKDRKALSRATRKLHTIINQNKSRQNREHDGPGSRKTITNSKARYQTNE